MTHRSDRSSKSTDEGVSAASADVAADDRASPPNPSSTPAPPNAEEDEPAPRAGLPTDQGTEDAWEKAIREAVHAGKPEEALRYAFVWLRRDLWNVVRKEARRRGRRNVDDGFCEDVEQEAALRLWRALTKGGYDDLVKPGGFLRILVRRVIADMKPPESVAVKENAAARERPSEGLNPEQQVALAQAVRDCLQTLSVAVRVLLAIHLTSIDAEEAASRLGIAVERFYVRRLRARDRLKRCLQEKGYTDEELLHGLN